MAVQITRRLKPEEEEILRKRAELDAVKAALAERELELADLRGHLAAFEGRYLRQVGALYAELDEWKARIAELRAQRNPSSAATQQSQEAREQARQTHEAAHGEASKPPDFSPSPELKSLYREVAKRIHPDFAKDSADLDLRNRLMAEANRAYKAGDAAALRRILDEYDNSADAIPGEGVGAELIRIIRQISQARAHIASIEQELATLRQGEIAQLEQDDEKAKQEGRDLLAELATAVRGKIELARKEYEALSQ
jgi:peptidoglycan hydrolase CwlO-like protein